MSLYEIFFEMELGICERFPALSPFDVRRKKATEVFLLISRLNNYNQHQGGKEKKKVIRKPAGDDWF